MFGFQSSRERLLKEVNYLNLEERLKDRTGTFSRINIRIQGLTPWMAKSEVIRDLGKNNDKYTRVWDAVKAAE
jgi:hypothetical protein